jgi:ABC-2 type transport system ATP-binding protein
MSAVEASDVHKSKGGRLALAGIDLAVARGELLTVVGPNGAGKSTLLEILAGLARPDRGRVVVLGEDPAHFSAGARARVGVFLQPPGIPARLTVAEVLTLFALCYGSARPLDELAQRFCLGDLRHVQARYLSQGQRLRISLALAFVRPCDILFLDEPVAHVDPQGRAAFWEEIRRARAAGTAVVCATHMVEEARGPSDRLLVLSGGRAVALAPPEALIAPYEGLTKLELSTFDPALGPPLAAVSGVTRIQSRGEGVTLYCRDAPSAIAALAPQARRHSFSAGPVTLEDAVRLMTEDTPDPCG